MSALVTGAEVLQGRLVVGRGELGRLQLGLLTLQADDLYVVVLPPYREGATS